MIAERTYKNYLQVMGITDEMLWDIMDMFPIVFENKNIDVKPSSIHGLGCFTKKKFKKNQKIGKISIGQQRTELGRFVNHSPIPNIYLHQNYFYASQPIPKGEELVIDYFKNIETLLDETIK